MNKNINRLAEIRKTKGLRQEDVAKATDITRVFYTQVENGKRIPSLRIAKKIADILGMSLDDFFYALEVTKRNTINECNQIKGFDSTKEKGGKEDVLHKTT